MLWVDGEECTLYGCLCMSGETQNEGKVTYL